LRDGANLVSHALPRRPESVHRVDWFLDVARGLGIADPRARFPIEIPQSARDSVRDKLRQAAMDPESRFVVINQAAGNPPRRWGTQRFGEIAIVLAERYGLPTVLIGTAPEAADCAALARQVRAGLESKGITIVAPPVNLAGATTLKEMAALLDSCVLHISGDTGSTHIAAALDTPVIAFYGSTDPAHAGPWGQSDHVLARRDLCSSECTVRQCAYANSVHAHSEASAGTERQTDGAVPDVNEPMQARCLAAISVDEALVKVDRVLGAARNKVSPFS
jgi:ADP-heptose:LPS heptosyltransferase